MSKLKPCPFCGSNAGVLEYQRLSGPTLYKVVCNSRKCRGHDGAGSVGAWLENGWRDSREEAAELWNRRAERTCRMGAPVDGEYRCGACGHLNRETYRADKGWYRPVYCAHCGARAVSDDADR